MEELIGNLSSLFVEKVGDFNKKEPELLINQGLKIPREYFIKREDKHMEAVTTIRKMLSGNRIFVPSYQRAYSWDIDADGTAPKQISTFLSDIRQHIDSCSKMPYYFGHFLFEDKGGDRFAIIDGQQRLTTIVILLYDYFIRSFLIEMGGDFAFLGNQYHLKAGERDLYIDLLLFHRRLHSLIAIELKIGEFEAEYAGKMQLYLTALDEIVKLPEENPSIGIIICKSKDKTYVEYALKQSAAPIGVATYKLSSDLPENMKSLLPDPDAVAARLAVFENELAI